MLVDLQKWLKISKSKRLRHRSWPSAVRLKLSLGTEAEAEDPGEALGVFFAAAAAFARE